MQLQLIKIHRTIGWRDRCNAAQFKAELVHKFPQQCLILPGVMDQLSAICDAGNVMGSDRKPGHCNAPWEKKRLHKITAWWRAGWHKTSPRCGDKFCKREHCWVRTPCLSIYLLSGRPFHFGQHAFFCSDTGDVGYLLHFKWSQAINLSTDGQGVECRLTCRITLVGSDEPMLP